MKHSYNYIDKDFIDKNIHNYTDVDKEAAKEREKFLNDFSPTKLQELDGEELLNSLMHRAGDTHNLCRSLEWDAELSKYYGGIQGGSSLKFPMHYDSELKRWFKGSTKNNRNELSLEEGITEAYVIRDVIIRSCELVENMPEERTINDYKVLAEKISKLDRDFSEKVWFLKYLTIYNPAYLAPVYADYLHKESADILDYEYFPIKLENMGKINLTARKFGLSSIVLSSMLIREYNNRKEINEKTKNKEIGKVAEEDENYEQVEFPRAHNKIFFGAPGTGKSYRLNTEAKKYFSNKITRVTFHPEYSYAQFVGTYKPTPTIDKDGNEYITYSYIPGPFINTLVKAILNPSNDYLLIIEEINRANAAAVFGDIFQLLDRKDGVSEYPIEASLDLRKYLSVKLRKNEDDVESISLPSNMYIWATMNSADQGVYPLDTAFKRRWEFEYIGIDESEEGINDVEIYMGNGEDRLLVNWNKLRKAINKKLLTYNINEDKLIGPYFIDINTIINNADKDQFSIEFNKVFKNKVLMYLFEDAARSRRQNLFLESSEPNLYSKICSDFDNIGIKIFHPDIISELIMDKTSIEDEVRIIG